MFICPVCFKPAEVNQVLNCGECESLIHYQCAGYNNLTFKLMVREARRIWKCFKCESKVKCQQISEKDNNILKTMTADTSELKASMELERLELNYLMWKIKKQNPRLGITKTMLWNLEENIKTLKNMIIDYRTKKQQLSEKIKCLQEIIIKLQNEEMNRNKKVLRICGMSNMDPSNFFIMRNIKQLAEVLGIPYNKSDVISTTFMYPVMPTGTPSICVEFKEAEVCKMWMERYVKSAKMLLDNKSRVITFQLLSN